MNIDTWTSGYKIRAVDWIDGKNIYLNIAYYKPGSSLERPPEVEKSVLIPKEESYKLKQYLDSIVKEYEESGKTEENFETQSTYGYADIINWYEGTMTTEQLFDFVEQ